MDGEYTIDDIKAITTRDVVRKRPDIYAGEVENNDAVIHLFLDILDHGIYLAERSLEKTVKVISVYPEAVICYSGDGFPFDELFRDKMSNGERYLEYFHAGPQEENWPSIQDPLGLCIPNYLSKRFNVRSWRKGKLWECEYKEGLQVIAPNIVKEGKGSETEISFLPDGSIFKNYTNLEERFRNVSEARAKENPNIRIEFLGVEFAI